MLQACRLIFNDTLYYKVSTKTKYVHVITMNSTGEGWYADNMLYKILYMKALLLE